MVRTFNNYNFYFSPPLAFSLTLNRKASHFHLRQWDKKKCSDVIPHLTCLDLHVTHLSRVVSNL